MWCPFLSPFWSGSNNTWKNASKGSTSYWWNIDGSLHFCHISVIYRRINTSDKRAVRGFFSSPIMPLTSSMYQFHAGLCFSGSIVTNFPHLSSLPQIWGFTSNSCTFHLKICVAGWVEWFENVCVGPVRKDWFGNTVHFVTSRYLFYERKVWIN